MRPKSILALLSYVSLGIVTVFVARYTALQLIQGRRLEIAVKEDAPFKTLVHFQSPAVSRSECPRPVDRSGLEFYISYERTKQSNPFKNAERFDLRAGVINGVTVFDVTDLTRADRLPPGQRELWTFRSGRLAGLADCSKAKQWTECVREASQDAGEPIEGLLSTCVLTLRPAQIPVWMPSPNDLQKQKVAMELRDEIEKHYPGVQQIVARDFNLKDPQITFYAKFPDTADAVLYQGCSFNPEKVPVCGGWHSFGTVPLEPIREWIFEKPYGLK